MKRVLLAFVLVALFFSKDASGKEFDLVIPPLAKQRGVIGIEKWDGRMVVTVVESPPERRRFFVLDDVAGCFRPLILEQDCEILALAENVPFAFALCRKGGSFSCSRGRRVPN